MDSEKRSLKIEVREEKVLVRFDVGPTIWMAMEPDDALMFAAKVTGHAMALKESSARLGKAAERSKKLTPTHYEIGGRSRGTTDESAKGRK